MSRYYEEYCSSELDQHTHMHTHAHFLTLEVFIRQMDAAVTHKHGPSDRPFSLSSRVQFPYFKEVFHAGLGKRFRLDALVCWTQIRSFIKGSLEAGQQLAYTITPYNYN